MLPTSTACPFLLFTVACASPDGSLSSGGGGKADTIGDGFECAVASDGFAEEGMTDNLAVGNNGHVYGLTDIDDGWSEEVLCVYASDGASVERKSCRNLDRPRGAFGLTGLSADGGNLFLTRSNGPLYIFDIATDPAEPALLGQVSGEDRRWLEAYVRGTTAVISDGQNGVDIADISDPSAPILVGRYAREATEEEPRPSFAVQDVAFAGDLALLAVRGEGLEIIDISDPTAPTFVGRYQPDSADRFTSVYAVSVVDDRAYLAVSSHDAPLHVLDLSDPVRPEAVHFGETLQFSPTDLDIAAGRLAITGAFDNEVALFALGEAGEPVLLGQVDVEGLPEELGLGAGGESLYYATGDTQRHGMRQGVGVITIECE